MICRSRFPLVLCWMTFLFVCNMNQVGFAHTTAEEMTTAANRFLISLTPEQREKVEYSFEGKERTNWQFIPMERTGLAFKEMKPHQQHLAMVLMQSVFSHRGASKALNIMMLEQILHEMENQSPKRDPSLYHFYIFGKPSTTKTWGWRFEGHHLSVSVTIVDGHHVVGTPSFYGANPAVVRQGPHKGLRVLHQEEDLGRELVKSLDAEQKQIAVFSETAPPDVINGPGRKAAALEPQGLSAKKMNKAQRQVLMEIVREYVQNLRPELAREDMKKIREAGTGKIHFAWAGNLEPGKGHYYRVQGPTFVMEYDNTQNDANHVHCVWRDLQNDFGEDLLKKHYDAVKHTN